MLHGNLDVLDLDYIIAVIGLNAQMNSKKQEVLKSDRMKEMKRICGVALLCHFASCMTFTFIAFVPVCERSVNVDRF